VVIYRALDIFTGGLLSQVGVMFKQVHLSVTLSLSINIGEIKLAYFFGGWYKQAF
jgi:hypothetical protein